jgi:DNA-binding FadR family transcriptional regulator
VAQIVAAALRDEILRGELSVLPRLDDLVERFEVGVPAAREALRILQAEGLITPRRGNVGGADVHLPTSDGVAYMLSMVLQSRSARASDVGAALRQLEPLCAALCAARPDRHDTIVPELRARIDEQAAALGDARRTRDAIDGFHEAIVAGCGNESLLLTVGALERIWSAHAEAVYETLDHDEPSDLGPWTGSLRDHERILKMIERGDAAVAAFALKHLEATQAYMTSVEGDRPITASTTTLPG